MKVIHAVYTEGVSSVFASQVLARMPALADDVDQEVVVLAPVGHLLRKAMRVRNQEMVRLARETFSVKLSHIYTAPTRLAHLSSPVGRLKKWLARHVRSRDPIVLHCRNAMMAWMGIQARDQGLPIRVIYDCRGVEVDEYPGNFDLDTAAIATWPAAMRQQYESLKTAEARAFVNADGVLCVADAMLRHFAEIYPAMSNNTGVVPCCVDVPGFAAAASCRDQSRKKLGLDDRFVVTYLGSLAWYQLPHESLRIFRMIRELIPNAHFLAITTDPDAMHAALNDAAIAAELATVVSVSPSEVPEYLAAADVGLLLREPNIVNKVASPVKFGEYLASGTPVIIGEGVGDYSSDVRSRGLGVCLDIRLPDAEWKTTLDDSKDLLTNPGTRERCASFAADQLQWSRHRETLLQVYQSATGSISKQQTELVT